MRNKQHVTSNKKLNGKSISSRLSLVAFQGFTLIEILVVISILGILAVIALGAIKGVQGSSRDAKRKADLADIRSALEIYRADCASYPDTLAKLVSGSCTGNAYMSQIPTDPKYPTYTYLYVPASSNKTYTLCAYTEHGTSTTIAACNAGCGGAACNYSLINP